MSRRNSDMLQTSRGVSADQYFTVTSDTVIEMLYYALVLDRYFASYLHKGCQKDCFYAFLQQKRHPVFIFTFSVMK